MYLALILYGSHARGDNRMKSDVDILAITAKGLIDKNKPKRGVSLHEYPLDFLKKQAEAGNLFLSHIVHEGVPLSDPLSLHKQLKRSFEFKTNYDAEKKEAAAILWYCKEFATEANQEKLRKRIIWSIRTIIISDAAEKKIPIFSSRALENYSKIDDLKTTIDSRNTIQLEKLFLSARLVLRLYTRSIRPSNRASTLIIDKWMRGKGKMAGQTPYYLGLVDGDFEEQPFYT